jgi:hypothetical protein
MEKTLDEIGCTTIAPLHGELWRPVTDTNEAYWISNMGRLLCRNWKGSGRDAIMKPAKDAKGYVRTMLKYGDRFRTIKVHRIVAQEWVDNPGNKPHVDHMNFVRDDNRSDNLRWVTPLENTQRSHAAGNFACVDGSKNPFSKLNEKVVVEIRRRFKGGETRRQLAHEYGVAPATIKDVVLRSWKHVKS